MALSFDMSTVTPRIDGRSSPKIAGYFHRGRVLSELCFETDLGLIFLIEVFSDGGGLPMFELGDLD
jgi:hypothetical protein